MLARINKTYPSFLDEFLGKDYYPVNYKCNSYKNIPAVNITEGDNEWGIEVAAPGLDKKDFRINVENDVLTIASAMKDRKEENTDQYTRREFRYSNFSRSFNLPETADTESITASHKNGILNVSIPKKEEAKAKPARDIAIK